MILPTERGEGDVVRWRKSALGGAWLLVAALAGVLGGGAACKPRVETRCHRVCSREAECAEQEHVETDRSECIEACIALDRDPRTQALVDAHTKCVDEAASCRVVLACQ